jgi:DNA-binding transcriptional LysR family regulator
MASLENAGRPYRVVLETPSLAALRAAVQSGLGVTCRSALFMENAIPSRELPPLPHVTYVSRVRENPHPAITRLAELIRTASRDLR